MTRPLWDEALDRQLHVAGAFRSRFGPDLLAWMMARSATDLGRALMHTEELAHGIADQIASLPTYAVTAEMCQVIRHGVDSLGSEAIPLTFDMALPSESGFVWLEEPQIFPTMNTPDASGKFDLHPRQRPIAGLWWMPSHVEVAKSDEAPEVRDVVLGITTGVVVHKNDSADIETIRQYAPADFPEYLTFDMTGWAANRGWTEVSAEEYEARRGTPGVVHPAGGFWRRWLVCFWSLATEHLYETPVSRPVRRRAERAAIRLSAAPDYGQVRVVTLRRRTRTPEDHEAQPTDVHWSHRWMVTGHWRWQAHGPARSLRRLTWIAPYVKGPDDRPLVIRDDVAVLRR